MEQRLCVGSGQNRHLRSLDSESDFWHTVIGQLMNVAFIVLSARVKPGKFYCTSCDSVDASGVGASPFVISYKAFPGPHSRSGTEVAPLLFPDEKGARQDKEYARWRQM